LTTALAPTDETVELAISNINELGEGSFKTRLLSKVGNAFLEFVQQNPDVATAEDLIKAGFERVNEDYIENYQEGMSSLKEEIGTIPQEVIQQVIDTVNGLEEIKSLTKAKELQRLIEQLPDSVWKDEKLLEVKDLINKLTPGPIQDTPSPPIEKGEPILVEGTPIENGTEFEIDVDTITEVAKENNQDFILRQDTQIEITIPAGAIDFASLQKEFEKYGLVIQLIKLDEQNYRLRVTAVTAQGVKELTDFEKHLKVAVNGGDVSTAALRQSVVLRKDGDKLTPVPHHYVRDAFTIRTTRAGYFVVVENEKDFSDISGWYSETQIRELANRHIVSGTSANKYSPSKDITRAELAVMIARSMDLRPTKETPFTDIRGKWYEKEVQALYEAGIITGVSRSRFNPNGVVLREQGAAMMARALQYAKGDVSKNGTLSYKDNSKISNYAKSDVALLHALNIMTGTDENHFSPKAHLTRGQMAKLLHGTLKYIEFL
jgi:hypothetical protein